MFCLVQGDTTQKTLNKVTRFHVSLYGKRCRDVKDWYKLQKIEIIFNKIG